MRKIIQIAVDSQSENDFGSIVALCDDGSLWHGDSLNRIDREIVMNLNWMKIDTYELENKGEAND